MKYLQAHFLMAHFYSVCKVAGGVFAWYFSTLPGCSCGQRQAASLDSALDRTGRRERTPPVFSWKYIISFIISSLLHSSPWPWTLPPHLLHFNFKWKAFNGVQKTTSPSLETGPWFLLEVGIPHPSIPVDLAHLWGWDSDASMMHLLQPWGLLPQT